MGLSLKSIFSSLHPEALESASRVVGIDIGSAAIKVVEIEQTDRSPVVRTYGELQLGPYADTDIGKGVKLENKQRLAALIDVFREAGVTARKGVLALPLSSSFVTVVPLVLGKKDDISNRITIEARKYIPISLQDVTLDWVELPAVGEKTKNQKTNVLLVALQNAVLSDTNQLLTQVEMSGQPTELEIFSLMRAVADTNLHTYAVLDLGAGHSCLYIVHEGFVMQVHRSNVGGTAITSSIASRQQLSFEEAELLKRTVASGSTEETVVHDCTQDTLADPLAEFHRLMRSFTASAGAEIEQVIMTGGVAVTPGITSLLQDALQVSVVVADPFSKVAYPAFMEDTLRAIGPTFAGCIGAALRLLE